MLAFRPQGSSPVQESRDGTTNIVAYIYNLFYHTNRFTGSMNINQLLLQLERNLEDAKLSLKR